MSIKKLKDIDAIRRGDYVDEGDVDIAQDRPDNLRSEERPQSIKPTERAVAYKYQQFKRQEQDQ
jgi:hypothetical protein